MSDYWLYAVITGVIVILVLAFYAGKLLRQLKVQSQQQIETEIKHKNALNAHDKKILDSVVIIVRAMKEEQCDYSEGCWRISVLLDSLKTSQALDQEFPAIFSLYEQIKHLSILADRKTLSKQQRMKQDLERMKAEAELHPKILKDLGLLHQYATERISMLTT